MHERVGRHFILSEALSDTSSFILRKDLCMHEQRRVQDCILLSRAKKEQTKKRSFASTFVLIASFWLFNSSIPWVWAETYYQHPKSCQGQSSPHPTPEQQPQDPSRFLSPIIQNQGMTTSCGFHAGTVLLEALVNSQKSPSDSRKGLSVINCMEQLGVCTKSQFESKATSIVPFLLKMRNRSEVRSFDKTVLERYTELCNQPHFEIVNSHNINDLLTITSPPQKTSCENSISIPPYRIKTFDFNGTEKPQEISESLRSYFEADDALPLGFHSCVEDFCTPGHAIALIGIKKTTCESGVVFYTGLFKNSYGNSIEEYDLDKMLEGMIKYHEGYSTVRPCKDSQCLDSPIEITPNSNPIFHLAEAGDIKSIEVLHSKQIDVNVPGKHGNTPFYAAAQNGHLGVVKYLLSKGADINKANAGGLTPLNIAARSGQLDVVEYLVSKYADINKADTGGFTPLISAVHSGHLDAVEYLVGKNADINKTEANGYTPLNIAAYTGQLDVAKHLMSKGADINKANHGGWTPLISAINQGYLEIAVHLIEHGAEIDPSSASNSALIMHAAQYGHINVIRKLKDKGADINIANTHGVTPLNIAAQSGHLDVVEYLVRKNADTNKTEAKGYTPLNSAAYSGQLDVVKHLVSKGADINKANHDGWTPLISAINQGHLEIAVHLIEHAAEIDPSSASNSALIIHAAQYGHINVLRKLKEKGADLNQKDSVSGWTPLHGAAYTGQLDVVEYLVSEGADINTIHANGVTPLNSAAYAGHLNVVKHLMNKGADMNIANHNGYTPLNSAAEAGQLDVVKYLISRDANPLNEKDGWSVLQLAQHLKDKKHGAEILRLIEDYIPIYKAKHGIK
ncbi:MAG: ankyrin repeat domain-containing protein [Oligoflexia bacterium]|nr:ankyrin repeat domain-containing protein [Oligoflexia bacterium]